MEEKRQEEKRPWRITNVGCTHNKISVVLDAAGEGYNDGACYVMDADGTEVERLGIVPKKKRVVLTDKELFEDEIWLASHEKRDEEDGRRRKTKKRDEEERRRRETKERRKGETKKRDEEERRRRETKKRDEEEGRRRETKNRDEEERRRRETKKRHEEERRRRETRGWAQGREQPAGQASALIPSEL